MEKMILNFSNENVLSLINTSSNPVTKNYIFDMLHQSKVYFWAIYLNVEEC